ncbi:MAG: OsmC family protein [Pseudomonadota bacterium]
MALKVKPLINVRLTAHCPTMSLTEVRTRGHSFIIDEPPERHGTDVGPTPLETMLGAFMSCTHVIAARIAHERGVTLEFDKMSCLGRLDHRGIDREADVPVPFPTIELDIAARTDMDPATIEDFKEELEQRCPMSVILRQAGTEITQTWTFGELGRT